MSEPVTVADYLKLGERVLTDSTHVFEDHDNASEARELLAHVLEIDEDELDPEDVISPRRGERYLAYVARRAGGEPFPFLTGHLIFWGLDLKVEPGAFVPRPSSELTVARAVRLLRKRRNPIVLDVCTGSGPIALAIADDVPTAEVWGTDISREGLGQGRRNARRLGIKNVTFKEGDMYGALPDRLQGSVDVITGHVPYVPQEEIGDLPAEVREYEPLNTLTDQSDDGLSLLRVAIYGAPRWLKPGGWLLLEISHDLPPKLKRMTRRAGLEPINVATDEDDLSVVLEARMPERTAAELRGVTRGPR
ncbi:MAG: peptide chain release factor N(5)-glutamine methyltransferase [Actinomycetota bacterium]|nr:peptide chain release factor N(5)-glutamine methyltransferase [Actinomycetota bacterium]